MKGLSLVKVSVIADKLRGNFVKAHTAKKRTTGVDKNSCSSLFVRMRFHQIFAQDCDRDDYVQQLHCRFVEEVAF